MIYKILIAPIKLAKYLGNGASFNAESGRFFGEDADKLNEETKDIPVNVKRVVFTFGFFAAYVVLILIFYVTMLYSLSLLVFCHSALWLLIPALFLKGMIKDRAKDVTCKEFAQHLYTIAKNAQKSGK